VNLTSEIVKRIRRYLDAQEEIRDRVLEISRRTVRNSAQAMAALHRGDEATLRKAMREARREISLLSKMVKKFPHLEDYGPVATAYQEFAEVKLVQALSKGKELPGPEELGIPYKPYLAALADSVGEFRRRVLDLIRTDKVAEAERTLGLMEEIFSMLMEFDYPSSILPGMRHKCDVARRVLEETRSDVTTALRQQRLEHALEKKEGKL